MAASSTPTITTVRSVSHTIHDGTASGAPITAGAPGMPIDGPRLALAMAASATTTGLAADPAIIRADARFGTGCSTSSTRT